MTTIMKWYFCIDWKGAEAYAAYIKAAVISCRRHTDLQPICVCYDPNNQLPLHLTTFFDEYRVRFIRHKSRVFDAIIDQDFKIDNFSVDIAAGAYLRFEVPLLEKDDEFVLYTDCDVLFCKNFSATLKKPRYFSCAPEFDPGNWNYFNSGVMLMNIEAMRRTSDALMATALGRLRSGIHCAYDQGDLNAFYYQAWDHLPLEFNWKPYWGINEEAKIIHFHGPKPTDVRNLQSGGISHSIYEELYNLNSNAYNHYIRLFSENSL